MATADNDDDMKVFLGPTNGDYYLRQFQKLSSGSKVSWNWPAFFITTPWLLYRKMWAWTAGYVLGVPLAMVVVILAITLVVKDEELAASIYMVSYLVVLFVLAPMFANAVYFSHAKAKIQKVKAAVDDVDQQRLQLARVGGTSGLGVLIALVVIVIPTIGILAAVAIPAYQDYTIRAQVAEGLMLSNAPRAAVEEYILEYEQYPMSNAEVGLSAPDQISGEFVSSITVDQGVLVITYGNDANYGIHGRQLFVGLDEEAFPELVWVCGSADIEDRWLPEACRR